MSRSLSALVILASLLVPATSAAAQSIPRDATGIWGQRSCSEARNTYLLINSSFALIFDTMGADAQVTVGPAQWAGGSVMMTRPEGVMLLPAISALNRCNALPTAAYALFGEAITAFATFDTVTQRCTGASARTCIGAVFAAIDISNDQRLSVAEVNRAFRAAGFFVAYEALLANRQDNRSDPMARLRVGATELSASTIVTSIGGPFVTSAVMSAYDFNGDGFLSLEEILQDRGPLDVIPAGDGLTAVAAHAGLQTIIRGLPAAANSLGSFLSGLVR